MDEIIHDWFSFFYTWSRWSNLLWILIMNLGIFQQFFYPKMSPFQSNFWWSNDHLVFSPYWISIPIEAIYPPHSLEYFTHCDNVIISICHHFRKHRVQTGRFNLVHFFSPLWKRLDFTGIYLPLDIPPSLTDWKFALGGGISFSLLSTSIYCLKLQTSLHSLAIFFFFVLFITTRYFSDQISNIGHNLVLWLLSQP